MPRELKVDAEKLAAEVAWLAKMPATVPATAVIQVTSLLSAVMLRRSCFDRYQESIIPASGVAQASILVDANKLYAALKTVSGDVTLSIEDGVLRIKDSKGTARVKTADDAVQFPKWPQFEGRGKAVINSREMVRVLTSAGSDETMPQLMTVAFDDGTMVATDRFRLSAITYSPTGFVGQVPTSVLKPLAKVNTTVFVEAGTVPGDPDQWIELRSGMRTVTAPMPEREFTKWRALVPQDAPLQVLVPKEALLGAVSGDEVTLMVDGDIMTVVSTSDDVETEQEVKLFQVMRSDLDVPFRVSIRSKYVKDALQALTSGLVLFEGVASNKPVAFRDIAQKDLHLLMPLRTPA